MALDRVGREKNLIFCHLDDSAGIAKSDLAKPNKFFTDSNQNLPADIMVL